VVLGRDAEEEWVDVMRRLRKYVEARASADDLEKQEEGKVLLAPLLDALKKMHADAAARTTRRGSGKKRAAKAAETKPAEARSPEPSTAAAPSTAEPSTAEPSTAEPSSPDAGR
jgi:peptidoglycan hydrolase CwlO-like protein